MLKLMLWDWRQLVRSRMAQVLVTAWLLSLAAAVLFGYQRTYQYQSAAHELRADFAARQTKLERQIEAGDQFAVMPLSTNGLIVLSPPPLLDVVSGRSDLEPMNSEVNMWTLTHLLFLNHQTANAATLALGQFDVGFVILYLLPVLLIVLGYSAVTAERASGLERMLKGYGVDIDRLLRARLLARGLILLAPLLLVLLLHYGHEPMSQPERGQRLLVLGLITSIYAAFWLSLIAWVNARARTDGQALQRLGAVWVVLTLLIPAAVGTFGRSLYPAPSRFDLLATARRVEIDATQQRDQLLAAYATDHPNLLAKDSESTPLWQKGVIVVTGRVNDAVTPVHNRFDEQLLRQQQLTERIQFLSPVLIAQRALVKIAGTDESRFTHVRRQAANYLHQLRDTLGQMAMAGVPLTIERLRAMPQYRQEELPLHSVLRELLWPIGLLMIAVLIVFRFSRVPQMSS